MRVLVTGASGFIGASLVRRLATKGHDITCLVRKTSKTGSLAGMPVRLLTCDILDKEQTRRAFEDMRPEAVFHCAAAVMEPREEELIRVNAGSTRNICDASLNSGVKRMVYLSSIAVINGNENTMLTDQLPYKPNSAYGRSKVAAEIKAIEYRERGLKTAIIRPCMVYGEDEPHALGRILNLVSKRRLFLPDVEKIDSRLQMAYVGNVAQMMELALYNDNALEGTFLAADRDITTVRMFFESLYREAGAGSLPMMPGWILKAAMIVPPVRRRIDRLFKERVYDISRAEKLLRYEPEVPLEEGLRRTVKHWMDKRGPQSA